MNEAEKRKAARQRRANVKARAPERTGLERASKQPALRVFPNPIQFPSTDPSVLFPVYIPHPVPRDSEGRRPLRELVCRIRAAAGVTALLAHDHLMAQGGGEGSEWATEIVARHASLTPGYLSQHGREELARLRLEGEDFDRLVAFLFVGPEYGLTKNPAELADAYLKALGLLTTTLVRVMRIVAEADRAYDIKDNKNAGDLVIESYLHGTVEISSFDMVRIAALADINPAPIWPMKARLLAPMLEIARFGGRLVKNSRLGGQVRLSRDRFDPLRHVLRQAGSWPDDEGAATAFLLAYQIVTSCVDVEELLHRLGWADDFELDLMIGEHLE